MRKGYLYSCILTLSAIGGLCMIREYSFLLFHSLAEGFTIAIACAVFMITWNTRDRVRSHYFLFCGIAYLFIGGLDLVHMLIYKGMNIFNGYGANAATQLWVAARYMESISLWLAPVWIGHKLPEKGVFWSFAGVFAIVLAAVLSGRFFPDCYIDGKGLTSFKIASEYIICLILLAALAFLFQKRRQVDPGVLPLLMLSIILTMASEVAFMFYVNVYALSNQIGHYLKIVSFFLIYKAIIQAGLRQPYDVLFRDLDQSRQRLKAAHDLLQQQVRQRTIDVQTTAQKLQTETAERKQDVIEEERQLLVAAMEQAGECIAIADSESVIEYINQAVERITGLEPQTCIGQPITALLPFNQAMPVDLILQNLKADEAWSGRIKTRNIKGRVLDLSVTISPVREPTRKKMHFVAIIRDISSVCQMEYQLFQGRKMEAVGTLAGGIAHDFNNILSAILGYAELTVDIVGQNTMARENLKEVLRAGQRARELVHQILTFSRQTMPECRPVYLKHIIEEAVMLLRSSLPSTIEIRQRLDSNGLVMADPGQMRQVVMNLCTNAAHAMREKGGLLELVLEDDTVDAETAACYTELQPGPFLKLIVNDTGYGIPQEIMDHIFDPFFTTKANGEGTGMGLSVVHGIVHACGGMISVSSEPQKGSCFSVLIPAIACNEKSSEPVKAPIPLGDKEHILFIDDEPSLVNIGRQVLESLGYRVTTRTDGTEALDLVKAQPNRFDLVFTDMTMPKITGDVLAREILTIRPGLPVIVCSGFSHKMDEHKATAMGIRAYVRKPVLREEMARIIREVLGKKTSEASLRKNEKESNSR